MRASLILASTSPYRRDLLKRLRLRFAVEAPQVPEGKRRGESPRAQALRLAAEKARAISLHHPGAWVIGADQVAECRGRLLEKPGSAAQAIRDLEASSGRIVRFHTAVSLCCSSEGRLLSHVDLTRVHLRRLTREEIVRYVALDAPFDCAGAFRAESLGVSLMTRIDSEDPTALIGLPLIWLAQALRRAGFAPAR